MSLRRRRLGIPYRPRQGRSDVPAAFAGGSRIRDRAVIAAPGADVDHVRGIAHDVAGVTVTGVVFDSVAQAPLAGAMIQMGAEAGDKKVYAATTDSTGAYRIDGVPSGSYLVTFFHPALEGLGLRPLVRRALVGSDSAIRVDYAIPSAQTIRAVICAPRTPSDSSGLLIGAVGRLSPEKG